MGASKDTGYGPFNRQQPWCTWWVWAWGVVAVGLLAMIAARVPFYIWLPITAGTFGPMEGYGLSRSEDPYPPLTQVVREYVPRWLAFSLIYGAVGLGGGTWFHFAHRWWLAALGALLGWLTAHFDATYDAPAVQQENLKYQWYAQRLGLKKTRTRLVDNQRARVRADARAFQSRPTVDTNNTDGPAG